MKCGMTVFKDIQADIEWYNSVFSQMGIVNRFTITDDSVENNVERLIREYNLTASNDNNI